MKKIVVAGVMVMAFGLFEGCFARQDAYTFSVFTQDKKPKPELQRLLTLTGVTHEDSISSIVNATQKAWLRKPGTERWHMSAVCLENEDAVWGQLRAMGFIDTVVPAKKSYRYLVVLGSLFDSVKLRFKNAIECIKERDVTVEKIVFLVGNRPCVADQGENEEAFKKFAPDLEVMPKDEYDMAKLVYEVMADDDIKQIPVSFVCAPMKKTADGRLTRPTTQDTIELWIEQEDIESGSCLVVSSQPFVRYQDSVVKTYVPKEIEVETIGQISKRAEELAVVLDTVARYLYQEKIRLEQEEKK